jgi:hypothetical protein
MMQTFSVHAPQSQRAWTRPVAWVGYDGCDLRREEAALAVQRASRTCSEMISAQLLAESGASQSSHKVQTNAVNDIGCAGLSQWLDLFHVMS